MVAEARMEAVVTRAARTAAVEDIRAADIKTARRMRRRHQRILPLACERKGIAARRFPRRRERSQQEIRPRR